MLQYVRQYVLPALIIAGGVAGYFGLAAMKEEPQRVIPDSPPPLVEVAGVKLHSGPIAFRFHGVVAALREIRVSAEVAGRIISKSESLRNGRVVRAGDPLMEIDPRPYELAVDRLRHSERRLAIDERRFQLEADHTSTRLKLAERRLTLAQQELARLEKLVAMDVSSQAERDLAERAVLALEDDVITHRTQVAQLPLRLEGVQAEKDATEAQRAAAELDLARTKIVAPADGVISDDAQETSNYVESGDPLFTLRDPSRFEVAIRLRSDELNWLYDAADTEAGSDQSEVGAAFKLPPIAARVWVDGREDLSWDGQLKRADGGGFDPATRTFGCVIVVDEPNRDGQHGPPSLIAGMFVQVEIGMTPRKRLYVLPRAALQPDGQVWIVEDGVLRIHDCTPARVNDSRVFIAAEQSTIDGDDRVVTSTLPMVFDGMEVRERDTR